MASYNGNLTQLSELFGTADTISETEDAEFLSASEAVKKLEEVRTLCHTNVYFDLASILHLCVDLKSWLNEMLSPELLQPQTELVDCLLEQTKNMEENLMAISKSDFRFALHRMEV